LNGHRGEKAAKRKIGRKGRKRREGVLRLVMQSGGFGGGVCGGGKRHTPSIQRERGERADVLGV